MMDPKRITPRDKKYLAFIREQPCLIHGCNGVPVDPAHGPGRRGAALKASDWTCLPLCRKHHDEQGSGIKSFQQRYQFDWYAEAFKLMHLYHTGVPV